MNNYTISQISSYDETGRNQVIKLLKDQGLELDKNLDYTCAVYDDDYNIIGTGSCFMNTLRCFAVSSLHKGEGILNLIMTHLMDIQFQRGNNRLFLYCKSDSEDFFKDMGFYTIAKVRGVLSFMENKKSGFDDYLEQLKASKKEGLSGAIVLNANPFTLGHLYLVEKAASECDNLHLFIVSEDVSLVPFNVRKKLVTEGTSHIPNIIIHESGPYIISNATFPSYFLKDKASVTKNHSRLDLSIFKSIATALNITRRYVGEEPESETTDIYNQVMSKELPEENIKCIIVPRKKVNSIPISASRVRSLIKEENWAELKELAPPSTYNYFVKGKAPVK